MSHVVQSTPDPSKMMELDEMNSIKNAIKEKIEAMWKAGYSYVIICEYATNALGIVRCTMIMKAISKIQRILDKINTDLNYFKKLLEECEKLGFPDGYDPNGKGMWEDMQEFSQKIEPWLSAHNDLGIKGPDGKPLTNVQAFLHIWNELFGCGTNKTNPKNPNTCLLAQLKNAMNNPWYKQTDNTSYKALAALNTDAFAGRGPNWQKNSTNGMDFQQFLQGKFSASDIPNIARTLMFAMVNSYCKNNNVKTDWEGSDATVEKVTSQSDSVVQSVTTLNSTQSADMSEFAQQLTALINIVQQMLQQNDKANTNFVNNQQAR